MARFNIFEGSRRIALLVKCLWVIGALIIGWMEYPNISLLFVTHGPGQDFQLATGDDCSIGTDGIEFISRDIGDGKTASIRLCFKARRDNSGQQVVPYKVESSGTWWGNGPYSSEVQAEAFAVTAVDQQVAREEWERQWWKNIRNGVLIAIGGWIALSLLQVVIGWVVRGFLGIPWGQDRRPETPDKTSGNMKSQGTIDSAI